MAEAQTETVAPHGEYGGAHAGMPQFNVMTFAPQLVWLTLTFVVLYVVLSKAVLPRIGGTIEARRNRISSDLDEAARLKRETEEAIAAYDRALSEARGRAHAIAAEQRAALMHEVEQRTAALEKDLAERGDAAAEQIRATKARALGNVEQVAVEAAQAIVAKLLGEEPDAETTRTAVAARMRAAS